jgi:hypothetical protein
VVLAGVGLLARLPGFLVVTTFVMFAVMLAVMDLVMDVIMIVIDVSVVGIHVIRVLVIAIVTRVLMLFGRLVTARFVVALFVTSLFVTALVVTAFFMHDKFVCIVGVVRIAVAVLDVHGYFEIAGRVIVGERRGAGGEQRREDRGAQQR